MGILIVKYGHLIFLMVCSFYRYCFEIESVLLLGSNSQHISTRFMRNLIGPFSIKSIENI